MTSLIGRANHCLNQPVSDGTWGIVRIIVGSVLAAEALNLIWPDGATSKLRVFFVEPAYLFKYRGFEWVHPIGENLLGTLMALQATAGLLLAAGILARPMATFLALCWGYVLFLDVARFNNHYYLQVLLCLILALSPAGRAFSLPLPGRSRPNAGTIPYWPIVLLRIQLLAVYFWGGVAKICPEWLRHGEPIFTLLQDPATKSRALALLPSNIVERAWPTVTSSDFALALSWGGMLFDLLIGPLLLWRPTRWFGVLLVFFFHATNHFILFGDIEFFPIMALGLTIAFFPPDCLDRWRLRSIDAGPAPAGSTARWGAFWVVVWSIWQFGTPALQFLMPEPIIWTAKAEQFFWRMKSAHRHAEPAYLVVHPPEGIEPKEWHKELEERGLLAPVTYLDSAASVPPGEPYVEFQPLHGERFLAAIDPAGESIDEQRQKVAKLWIDRFGHSPALVSTEPLSRVLLATEQRLAGVPGTEALRARVRAARRAASLIETARLPADEEDATWSEIHAELGRWASHPNPEVRGVVRLAIGFLHPGILENGPRKGTPALRIDDPELMEADSPRYRGVYASVDRQKFLADAGDLEVVADWSSLSAIERIPLPIAWIQQGDAGARQVHWNPYAELLEHQWIVSLVQPFLVRQYGRHVADRCAFDGRRPQVHHFGIVALAPYRGQYQVDPSVNVDQTDWRLTSILSWITPLDRTVDASRTFLGSSLVDRFLRTETRSETEEKP